MLPHVIAPTNGPARKVVVVGAGPAGLEAARVAAARGHCVVLFEAAPQPGGQVRLAAALPRRREIIGIVDWLESEIAHLGVDLRCSVLAEAADVLAEAPEVVVVASGGVPNTSFLADGEALAVTSWDILGGQAAPAREVLLFDDNGAHPGASCAEFLARAGTRLEFVTPERTVLPEIGGTNYPA
jgi:NADPH-dependent 2,4-dienoyl-CoA reductase/sulfur reductase-like enzyme